MSARNIGCRSIDGEYFAGRDLAAQRLGHDPDVVRAGAAADAHVVRAERAGPHCKLRQLETPTDERVECKGKGRCPSGDRRVSMVGAAASARHGTDWTATVRSTVSRISAVSGSIACGPPVTVQADDLCPWPARIRHAAAYGYPSRVRSGCVGASVTIAGSLQRRSALQKQSRRLAHRPAERTCPLHVSPQPLPS